MASLSLEYLEYILNGVFNGRGIPPPPNDDLNRSALGISNLNLSI
ncbi:hypothetical protein [Nonlabens arenilitoris]|nr:hypothetical protein [Nonlabens arenilitoris]